jgi:hypothetical protein
MSFAPHGSADDLLVDVTERAGITGTHENGAKGEKFLLETINGGAGWIDYDGDGDFDIYLVQGLADSSRAGSQGETTNRLLRNNGDGTFEDVTQIAGVGDRHFGAGLAVGDIDNDGDSDLYVTNYGRNTLYRNEGNGTFTDITEAAGVECRYWSSSAAFVDVNGDGLLDLYVANYLIYNPKLHPACTGNTRNIASYCHPNKYDGAPDSLFINRDGSSFEDISRKTGIAVTGRILSKGLGVLPTDFDGDGDMDILVANDSVPNFLWRNLGNGRFEDAALEAGIALNTSGKSEACMGVDGGDVNGDGRQDYFLTNFAEETDSLFFGEGDGFFDDATLRSGLAQPTFLPLGFGTRLFDVDLDGDLDIYVARGHILDNIAELHPGTKMRYAQTDQLFANDGKGHFTDVSSSSGAWFQTALVGRALATADYDSDGDLDLLVVNSGQRYALLENRSADDGTRHWIGVDLRGGGPTSRDAFGSRVRFHTPRGVVEMETRAAQSYMASNDPRLLIGLGTEKPSPVKVEVTWADGLVETFDRLETDRYHRLTRGAAK